MRKPTDGPKNRFSRYEQGRLEGNEPATPPEEKLKRSFNALMKDSLYRPVVEVLDAMDVFVNDTLVRAQTDADRQIAQGQRIFLEKLKSMLATTLQKTDSHKHIIAKDGE
jgi:hypothetical protein